MKGMKLYNRSTIYGLALKTFGPEAQALKLMEEAAELADVEIMIEQFRLNGMGLMIDYHKQQKLERLAERLGVTYAAE
ncbi:hypothetical protein PCO85_14230 [Prodigiosinella aquatilis]|nr:hypothetical protein [Prodigiosinella sp. LS101]WJV52390.1 hypothetical protein PCO85_14230 [Prodigiosinella sp. LS101]WJV56744.1 hypothetical protein PCO84_14215 [Pectobacteriaceae bacterium C111]